LVSLSMSGELNVFDPRVSTVTRVLRGPQKAITTATGTGSGTFVAGTADGRVLEYNVADGEVRTLEGEGHSNLVSGIASTDGKVISVGYDDKVREIEGRGFLYVPAFCSFLSLVNDRGTSLKARKRVHCKPASVCRGQQ
jgi:hypothetical protein